MNALVSYRASEAINISTLKSMARSPAHYLEAVANARRATRAMDAGTVTHLLTLEPERFEERVAVWTEGDRRGNAWKAFAEANADKLVVKPNEIEDCRMMAQSVRATDEAAALLVGGKAEVGVFWTDPVTGLDCKGRVDYLRPGMIVDLKTTRDPSPRAFARQCVALATHAQLAYYADGVASTGPLPEVFIIAIENVAPYDVVVYRVRDEILDVGRALYRGWLARLKECVETDEWPGIMASGIVGLELPEWAMTATESESFTLNIGGEVFAP